jgi:hypothetical protein
VGEITRVAAEQDLPQVETETPLANRPRDDSAPSMIRRVFLDSESRRDLIELARDGPATHRLASRAPTRWVLLDQGMSCQSSRSAVARR